ncbi:carbon-nitrogen hydrolase family protein [Ruminococcus sp.]|uniref:carbon-nitrogen hydrolase family protein n=1 Tax=Ruminococcus sp. TaxID=41978 RepID=UPI0025901249|nr:carbon-nitrogen hydrolase family protein [Ruminococcus sp.]MEE3439738.1 carbon-nitrogen hydrolase family protein [Ruminococcus sp.]
MKLALVQMSNLGSVELNLEKSLDSIVKAKNNGADLVLFPEVQLTEFFPQYKGQNVSNYAVKIDSEIVRKFTDTCRENNIMAVPNLYLLEDNKTYDASIFIDNKGKIKGVQKMVHIAQADKFFEQDYYTPSNDGFKVFETEFGNIGIVVCFDRHYPESIRTETLQGADLILIPTVNTKEEPLEMFKWELRVQAFHNSVCIAMCNRVGTEGEMNFSGESVVVDASGNVVSVADDKEQILYVDIDMNEPKKIRNSKPYTQLRRTEFYL